jgi:long-chain acyl-CoA synthetase
MEEKLKLITDYLYENEKQWADMVYLRQPIDGKYHDITWAEAMQQARKMANFLKQQGLKKGDHVAILSKNCAEWFIADFAIAMAGLVSVPLFATQHRDIIEYILGHAEVKLIFVGKLDDWKSQETGIPADITRVAFPYENSMPATYQWNDILRKYNPLTGNYRPDPNDIYTIVYTSGTTGRPKGVMQSFQGIANYIEGTKIDMEAGTIPALENNFVLSYLPLAHIYERLVVENFGIVFKSTISFVESLQTFAKNLEETQPTAFCGVPRIWTQFQMGILAKLPQHKLDTLLKIPVINSLIKKKLRKALGLSRSQLNLSGAAPISPSLLAWYRKLGIEISEGYGMTENLAFATYLDPKDNRPGTVGKARPGVELKLGENDEILTRSSIVMVGYYKDPEATKEAFTEDGFLHTGDKGAIDKDGFVTIIGRVRDTFKTDKGEFINPVPIENNFAKNTNIEQLCLIGLQLPQPVMIVSLSDIARATGVETVTNGLQKTLDEINKNLTKFERISHVYVVKGHWTPENAMLTPTLKVKRNEIMNSYLEQIKEVIKQEKQIVWE